MAFRRLASLRISVAALIEATTTTPPLLAIFRPLTSSTFLHHSLPPLPSKHLSPSTWSTKRELTKKPSDGDEQLRARSREATGNRALMIEEDEFDSVTDKIPEKPMTAAEGVSYTFIILTAFAILIGCLWAFISNYIIDPIEYTCFNITLEKLRTDPRVTVRVGESIKGYGSDSMNRRQRRIIRNRRYEDANGTEHIQIQFNIKGSGGAGVVYADMYQDEFKEWHYTYLYVDAPERGHNTLQRLAIVNPRI